MSAPPTAARAARWRRGIDDLRTGAAEVYMSTSIFRSYADKVDAYISGRPEYPAALLAELPQADYAIDLGAGTGIFTEFLALKAKRVLAVEPVAEMAQRIPVARISNIDVAIGSAEAI